MPEANALCMKGNKQGTRGQTGNEREDHAPSYRGSDLKTLSSRYYSVFATGPRARAVAKKKCMNVLCWGLDMYIET